MNGKLGYIKTVMTESFFVAKRYVTVGALNSEFLMRTIIFLRLSPKIIQKDAVKVKWYVSLVLR
jgi:hypothetical protein